VTERRYFRRCGKSQNLDRSNKRDDELRRKRGGEKLAFGRISGREEKSVCENTQRLLDLPATWAAVEKTSVLGEEGGDGKKGPPYQGLSQYGKDSDCERESSKEHSNRGKWGGEQTSSKKN